MPRARTSARAYRTVRAELRAYGGGLDKKKEIVALSKCDALDEATLAAKAAELKAAARKKPLLLSAASGRGVKEALAALAREIQRAEGKEQGGFRRGCRAPALAAVSGGRCLATRPGRSAAAMKAMWQGKVIAESEETREVGGYTYFPREAVRMELLRKAARTESDLACPHGVQFYDVAEGGKRARAPRGPTRRPSPP